MELLTAVSAFARVPLVIHGGAKDPASLTRALKDGHADAVCVASILHYDEWTIGDLKKGLEADGIPTRHSSSV